MAIPGYRTMTGDGLHFTMDAGIMTIIMVGHGCQDMNGDQLGYHGDKEKASMAGRL